MIPAFRWHARTRLAACGLAAAALFLMFARPHAWSDDGAMSIVEIGRGMFVGSTGHPVYAALGWLANAAGRSIGIGTKTSIDVMTFLATWFALWSVVGCVRAWRERRGLAQLPEATLILAVATIPFFMYYAAQIEVYMLSTALVFASLWLALRGSPAAGILFALAVGTHLNALAVAPIILIIMRRKAPLAAAAFIATAAIIFLTPWFMQSHGEWRNVADYSRWLIGGNPEGHFFSASARALFVRLAIAIVMYGIGIPLLLLAAHGKALKLQNDARAAVGISLLVTLLYLTSPIENEIEQLLLFSVLLTVALISSIEPSERERRALSAFAIVIAIIFAAAYGQALSQKERVVETAMNLARAAQLPDGSLLLSRSMSSYLIPEFPNLSVGTFGYTTEPSIDAKIFGTGGLLLGSATESIHDPEISYVLIHTGEREPFLNWFPHAQLVSEANVPTPGWMNRIPSAIKLPSSWKRTWQLIRIDRIEK